MFKNKAVFRWGHCARKIMYRRKKSAEKAIQRMQKSGHLVDKLNTYRCEFCDGYHVGNKGG